MWHVVKKLKTATRNVELSTKIIDSESIENLKEKFLK